MAILWPNDDSRTKKEPHNKGALELDNAVLELDNGVLELDDCSSWPTRPFKTVHGGDLAILSRQMRSFVQKVTK